MTNEELDRLEARVESAAAWMQVGKQMPWDGFAEARDLAVEQNRALIAEVKRLRGALVVVAEYEACIGDDYDQPIQNHARKALEGGMTMSGDIRRMPTNVGTEAV